ncbi:hypothetical protein [Cohaesibacter celericrescens]|uniref:Uncharacterized protein n=1 Tax=Cohaesibacter celericrescens TaxID=2067669 RepID=A0A2N5XQM1_9HYPH|nr:hypothetical protein [Cohaesibacter celericrescens]PLW76816.1 hypothetical protein C0081_12205 [Cohaesibacter celericrescens]
MTDQRHRQGRLCALSLSLENIDVALDEQRALIFAMQFIANDGGPSGEEGRALISLLSILSDHQAKAEAMTANAHKKLSELRREELSA